MDSDTEEPNPIVPHNSEVDCRSSPTTKHDAARKELRQRNVFGFSKPVPKDEKDGKAAIDSLKNRLYDRPENSEVFRTICRADPKSAKAQPQLAPHPPPGKSGSRTGPYRTTMFRRDFNRIHNQRNPPALAKSPVKPQNPDQGSGPIEDGPQPGGTMKGNGLAAQVDDPKPNEEECRDTGVNKVKSETSLAGDMEESASLVASSVGSRSRPTSLKSRTLSARSWGSVAGSAHSDINGSLHIIPPSIGIPDEETYLGRDVMEVIMRLRSRRNMSTDLEAIAEGLDPDWGLNNLQNLYIKEEDGKFLYCLPKNRKERAARYNPYDLVCVSSKEAQACSQYFTVTSSAITQIRSGSDSEYTPMMRWLFERKMFHDIHEFPVFAKFRSEICRNLFVTDEILQKALLEVRLLCEKACSSMTGVGEQSHAVALLHVDPAVSFTLDEFCDLQQTQAAQCEKQLEVLRKRVVDIVRRACQEMTQREGLTEWIFPEKKKKEVPEEKEKKKQKTDDEDKKGKPKRTGPSFSQMSQWRGVLQRLACFVRLVDFLVMELLRRVALVGMRTLLAQVKASSCLGEVVRLGLMEPRLEDLQEKKAENGIEEEQEAAEAVPLLRVELTLNVAQDEPKDGQGGKKMVTFNISPTTAAPLSSKGENASSVNGPDVTSYDDDVDSRTVATDHEPSVKSVSSSSVSRSKSFISLEPTEQDFESRLLDIVYGFEQLAASFTSLLRDDQLAVYVNPPASDVVYALSHDSAEEQRARRATWPDTELLFGEDPDYQHDVSQLVAHVKDDVENVQSFAKKFVKFCAMVDQANRTDVDTAISEREWSTDQFHVVLNQYTEQVTEMNAMTLLCRRGLFQVESLHFQQDCLPYPHKVLSAVARFLPVTAAKRNDALLNIIKHASRKLDKAPETVEAFVEHLVFLSRMGNEIASLEREYVIVTKLYAIARNFELPIPAEELALYQTLMPSFHHLKSTILYCEAKKDENIQRFSRALDELVIVVRRELTAIKNKVRSPALLDADNIPQVAAERVKFLSEELDSLATKTRNYATYQERFGSSMSSTFQKKALATGHSLSLSGQTSPHALALQVEVTEVEKDLALRRLLWEALQEWQGLVSQWEATPFDALNIGSVQKDVTRFVQTVFLLEKGLPPNHVVPRLKQKVMSFKQGLPVIISLRNHALRTRHWEAIQTVIGTRIVRDKHFTLGHLLQLKVFQHKEKIADISSQASNEATLEQMLQKVMDYWNHTDFQLAAHPGRDIAIITGTDDVITSLEESIVTLANIRGSRFVTPIKALVEDWDRKLTLFSRTLDEWLLCQRNWLYLETIFSAADIQRQLPNEARLFAQVDKSWRDIMRRTTDKPNAVRAATAAGVLEILQASNSHLEKIHRCLEDYLETKRLVFARFYFLSNEDLLEILANNKNPNSVQPHLRKCFGNIHQLEIVRQAHSPPQIKTMISEEGEAVALPKTLRARGNVESWLSGVEGAMYETVKMHLRKALGDVTSRDFTEWVLLHPGQAVLTVSQVLFSRDVQRCLQGGRPREQLQVKRDKLVSVLHGLSQLVTSALAPHQHQTLEALLTIDVHARDVLDALITGHVAQPEDFEWVRQLRYEWDDERHACLVRHSDATFEYGYEYLGCSPRLVITPLTDRCYLTLTGALNLHLNGAPAGPAGTGKTETVKDLAKAMGKQCLVFNCSEGLDYKMMGKFFSGLAQSGSWFCFDEFNRIDVEVLSVITQQLHIIKSAKDNNVARFLFEGRDVKLNRSCGVFITMNPGYAGRVELPDNLKSLFRPVAMMVPDYALIAEIILFSEGFTAAAMLSRKVVNLYDLASKQLSQQDHYDFGLRAIKSVLLMAGQQRRTVGLQSEQSSSLGEEEESHIIINAVKSANLPKFVAEDVPLFEGILEDLFPGILAPPMDNRLLRKATKAALAELAVQYWPSQIEKVSQLFGTLLVRHGVMLVGPAGGGKTIARRILKRALVVLPTVAAKFDQQGGADEAEETASLKNMLAFYRSAKVKRASVQVATLNPKCLTVGELYGEFNPITMEWTDGLLSHIYRKFAKDSRGSVRGPGRKGPGSTATATPRTSARTSSPARSFSTTVSEEQSEAETSAEADSSVRAPPAPETHSSVPLNWHWLVMDGPVDTLWIENLNTVLDDTKVLCLANGERISMGPGMRLLFEVDKLAMASPATVSRCGMVYMEPSALGWKPYVKSWVQRLREQVRMPRETCDHLYQLCELCIDNGLRFVQTHQRHQQMPAPALSMVSTLCSIISGFIEILTQHGGLPSTGSVQTQAKDGGESSETTSTKTVTFADDSEPEIPVAKATFVQQFPSEFHNFLTKVFVFAFTWAFGGNFDLFVKEDDDEEDRFSASNASATIQEKFDVFVRDLFEVDQSLGVQLPPGNDHVFSYYVDMETGQFSQWESLVPACRALIAKAVSNQFAISDTHNALDDPPPLQAEVEVDRSLVPTVDTVRYAFLISLMTLNRQSVLLTGDPGVGKSALIQDTLLRLAQPGGTGTATGSILGAVFRAGGRSLVDSIIEVTAREKSEPKESDLMFNAVQFTAGTGAARAQTLIESKLVKRGREVLGPRPGKKVVVFVDDLNMPQPDDYNSHPPLELLRQFLDSGGFYDTNKLLWKEVHDVTLLAACSPPGGGRSFINDRLLRHFSVLCLPHPSSKILNHIYTTQLGCFLEKSDFSGEVKAAREDMVTTAMALYFKVSSTLLPTPARAHYTFNLRDLNKVLAGLLQAHPSAITSREHCAQLLGHEAARVFHDRLIDDQDRGFFYKVLSDELHNGFKVRWSPDQLQAEPLLFADFLESGAPHAARTYRFVRSYDRLPKVLEEYYDKANLSGGSVEHRFVFFNMAIQHVTRATRVFRSPGGHIMMVGVGGTGKSTVAQLAAYIEQSVYMRPFVSRVYQRAEFRDDLKKAYMCAGIRGENTVLFLTDNVVKDSFLEDVSSILSCGEVSGLFDHEDYEQISLDLKKEAMKNGIRDTKQAIFQFFLQRAKPKLHIVLSATPSGSSFRRRCRLYPALINCTTIDWYDTWPLDALQSVAESFLDTTELVEDPDANRLLKPSLSRAFVEVHKSVEEQTQTFYEEMRRRYYTTPTSYMEFVRLYLSKLAEKKAEYSLNQERLCTGLRKLSESNELVGAMQSELLQLGPKLEQKSKDTEQLMEQLSRDQDAVDQVHSVVQKEEEIMNDEANRVQAIAEEAQRDLDSAIPQLEAAIAALDALDKSDISEIRVYTKPPPMVMTVLAAVCVLLQQKADWNNAKLLLGDPGFLKRLVAYDKNSVPEKVFTRLKKYTDNPEFHPEAVGKISVACKSMCQWVLALENYAEIYKVVQPKQRRCEEAQVALAMAKENLQHKQESLARIQEQLEILQEQYDESVTQLKELQEKKELTVARLDRASVLTAALAEEQVRWGKSVGTVSERSTGLVGDTLVATAAVAYLGAFTSCYRHTLLATWTNLCQAEHIPVTGNLELTGFLSEPVEIQNWLNQNLPCDQHSIENAVLMKHCRRWPLLIDPQEQASKWITRMEQDNGLKIVKASDPNYLRTLESAIPLGQPVLIEDVGESLDPSLNPILIKNTNLRGNQLVITIGDTEIEYNENFRLYMTTPLANPHFLPEVCIKVTIINFTVTLGGLQDQLLSRVVQQERPQLESNRKELMLSLVNDRYRLRELEDRSLTLLHSSSGNILDDEDLIKTLDDSKKMADAIQTRVLQSEETEEVINQNREKYMPVATRGAVLYFVLTDLASVDVMYQFSLPWFTRLFSNCIEASQETPSPRAESAIRPGSAGTLRPMRQAKLDPGPNRPGLKRRQTVARPKDEAFLPEYLQALVEILTENVYRVVSHALFARHQLTFSFMLCTGILRHAADSKTAGQRFIPESEWSWFLRGSAVSAIADRLESGDDDVILSGKKSPVAQTKAQGSMGQFIRKMNKSPAKWISEARWKECLQLSDTIPGFSGLCSNIAVNSKFWDKFAKSSNPYKLLETERDDGAEALSPRVAQLGWHWSSLSSFQRVVLVQVLRLDRLVDAARCFVQEQLGAKFVTSVGFDLQEIYDESNERVPLIFILSPGSDPTSQLMRFAKEVRGSTLHLDMISLGRGQGPRAEEAITKAYQQKGRWVFLQNCHHASSFMPRLQQIVRKISNPDTTVDPNFRMWLSSKPDPAFPVSILQAGLKMTVEPPPGLKANLLRSFVGVGAVVTESTWDDPAPGPAWNRLLFGLCFFNAIVHERKKFGALGWNIPYEFTASDLEVSLLMLHMLLTEHKEVPWQAVRYLTGDIVYGGRVTDQWDLRCLHSILGKFYSPDALQEDYGYTADLVYRPPPQGISLSVCGAYIEELPAVDSPELFGMNQNADTAFLRNQAKGLVSDLLAAQPRVTAHVGSNKTSDDVVLELARDILKYLPRQVDSAADDTDLFDFSGRSSALSPDRLRKLSQMNSPGILKQLEKPSALVTVLRQEIARFDRLLTVVHSSLNAVCAAVTGLALMSAQLEEAYDALLSNRVPHEWERAAYESCKPLGAWVDNLAKRVEFFAGWLEILKSTRDPKSRRHSSSTRVSSQASQHAPRAHPRAFWLPAFFFPQGFLTAVLQAHSRARGVSVDSLSFEYNVKGQTAPREATPIEGSAEFKRTAFQGTPPEDGVIVFGLHLDGASWDTSTGCLKESLPGHRFCPLPEVHFNPMQPSAATPDAAGKEGTETELESYECPVYHTSLRASSLSSTGHTTNYVTAVKLPSVQPADFWITRGVALLCQLDD